MAGKLYVPEPGLPGQRESFTPDIKKAEAEGVYLRTKAKAEEKAQSAKYKAVLDSQPPGNTIKLDPLSKALNQVTK